MSFPLWKKNKPVDAVQIFFPVHPRLFRFQILQIYKIVERLWETFTLHELHLKFFSPINETRKTNRSDSYTNQIHVSSGRDLPPYDVTTNWSAIFDQHIKTPLSLYKLIAFTGGRHSQARSARFSDPPSTTPQIKWKTTASELFFFWCKN